VLAKYPSAREAEIKDVQSEIEAIGRKALIVPTDVSQVAQLNAMVDKAKQTFGRVDILVNNAGWTGNSLALDVTEDEYDRTMAASLKSVFFACQAAARVMIPQGGGKIVNIGSNFGVIAFKSRSVYAAAKAGVHHLSRALSLEWARQGVTVNVVGAVHHGDRIAESDSRKAGLQGMGHGNHVAHRPLESTAGSCGSGAVLIQLDVGHGRGPRPDGRWRLDHPVARRFR
jgi:2-deoxy-D-gluconate 3-dehydrogenase